MGDMSDVTAALVQTAAATDSSQQRRSVEKWADQLAAAPAGGPDLVVLPEAMMHDFGGPAHNLAAVAEPLDGPFVTLLSAQARRLGATMIAGMFEQSDDPHRPYNTLVAVGPDGDLLGAARKVHLYDSFGYRESDRLRPGPIEPVVVAVGGLRVGLMTCYDLRFPEYARLLVEEGADTLCIPAAWVRGPLKEDHWATLLRARAIENTVYALGAAQCGDTYCGLSQVVDPMGVVVAAAGDEEGIVAVTLQPDRLAAARARNPALTHRRITRPPGPAETVR